MELDTGVAVDLCTAAVRSGLATRTLLLFEPSEFEGKLHVGVVVLSFWVNGPNNRIYCISVLGTPLHP